MNDAQRELCEGIMLLNCQSIKTPCCMCFLFTLMHYFGSEECFETNVSVHGYHALVPAMEQFLKHELDSFYMKLKGKCSRVV